MRTLIGLFYLTLSVWGTACYSQEETSSKVPHPAFNERITEREEMVKTGIENYPFQPVRDSHVLRAMRRVPRHVFVPVEYRREAYRNSPMSIGYNQTISQPYIVAQMTELLELKPDHKILEIGTGSGYQAAVLAELCTQVHTIEIIPPLGRQAEALLQKLGYHNIHVKIGDGYEGWPEVAPFDRIIVTCAPDNIPQPLLDQLAVGGRIVIPVGKTNQTQYMVVVTKDSKGRISQKRHYPVRFVPMTGKALQ